MTPIRLLALDIDGTLLDSRWSLSETNRSALRQAHDHDVRIVFVTGRRYHSARAITSTFDFPHFVITTAGATTRSSAGEVLFSHTIEPPLIAELLHYITAYRPWTFLISDVDGREELFCELPGMGNPHVAGYVARNRSFLTHVPDLAAVASPAIIEAVLLGHVAEMKAAVHLIDSFPLRYRVKVLRTEYIDRDLCLLDIVDGATDKGQAVRQLANFLGIRREAVMAIGDNHSDIDMLAFAQYPVVMGNATEELKALGWPTTASNDEDGVARAIERFVLASPSQTPAR